MAKKWRRTTSADGSAAALAPGRITAGTAKSCQELASTKTDLMSENPCIYWKNSRFYGIIII